MSKPTTPAKTRSTSARQPKIRPTRSDAQRQNILDAASLLFIEKGFGGTNINDIADAVGMTRTALYYYFPSKESMLEALTLGVTERASVQTKAIAQREELSPAEGLRELILQHASLVLAHPLEFRVVERSESNLAPEQRKMAQMARRTVRDNFVNVIHRGIEQGVFHPVDAKVAAFSLIGMCNWCAWWFDERRAMSPQSIAELLATLGLRMLLVDGPESAGQAAGSSKGQEVTEALAQMRSALELLEARL